MDSGEGGHCIVYGVFVPSTLHERVGKLTEHGLNIAVAHEMNGTREQAGLEVLNVRDIAIVGHKDAGLPVEEGLSVFKVALSDGRVPDMAESDGTLKTGQCIGWKC